jgi:hypothetical protein
MFDSAGSMLAMGQSLESIFIGAYLDDRPGLL